MLCAELIAWMAIRANGAPRVMTASMLLSWVSLAVIEDSMAELSVPFT